MKQIPKSKAKTAYGLLSEVRKIILQEPKRYNQEIYIERVADGDLDETSPRVPACGTIGCVAGWVATLKRGGDFSYTSTPAIAEQVLGISGIQRFELFSGGAVLKMDRLVKPGTVKYARLGAKHIARFMEKYATQLKAKKV